MQVFTPLLDTFDYISRIGLTSDANILIDEIRQYAQQYFYTYQEPIPIYQLVAHVCNYKQAYTQYGGTFPLFTSSNL